MKLVNQMNHLFLLPAGRRLEASAAAGEPEEYSEPIAIPRKNLQAVRAAKSPPGSVPEVPLPQAPAHRIVKMISIVVPNSIENLRE